MIVLWLLVGITAVSIAFFIPGSPPEVWTNLNYAGIATLIYMVALLVYTLRAPFTKKAKATVGGVSLVIILALAASWTGMDYTSHWQQQTLIDIRQIIGRGIIRAQVPDLLLSALQDFYRQPKGRSLSLGQVFRAKYPKAMVGDNIHVPDHKYDSLRVFLSALSDTQIVVSAQDIHARGRDPNFKNIDGRKGAVQERSR